MQIEIIHTKAALGIYILIIGMAFIGIGRQMILSMDDQWMYSFSNSTFTKTILSKAFFIRTDISNYPEHLQFKICKFTPMLRGGGLLCSVAVVLITYLLSR